MSFNNNFHQNDYQADATSFNLILPFSLLVSFFAIIWGKR